MIVGRVDLTPQRRMRTAVRAHRSGPVSENPCHTRTKECRVMRRTVLVPVLKTLCDAHIARDGSEEDATATLTLGERAWDLCGAHQATFSRYLTDALGAGVDDGHEPHGEPAPDDGTTTGEPESVIETEREAGADTRACEADSDDSGPEPVPSVMIAGEIPGYEWDTAREAVRNLGYEVVGRADDSTVLLILGEGGERNGTKLRDAAERDIPCMDVRSPGRFRDAIRAGQFTAGDPLPEPAKTDRSGLSERDRNRAVRAWAWEQGYAVPSKGRIPMRVRHAYETAHRNAPEGKAAAA
ncbi:histone-like nucleoid-structuring protein Lsr2 [Streptomyces sp. NPDC000594]|uniref:Lsr2 family DNA-binding protein n=1 Tax=Streptomyces sp. NPDC000594 TaxID=3154261 RepID=UPI003333A3A8